MKPANVLVWCFGLAPVVLIAGVLWAYLSGWIAIVVVAFMAYLAGYLTRWIDEGVASEYRILNFPWMQP